MAPAHRGGFGCADEASGGAAAPLPPPDTPSRSPKSGEMRFADLHSNMRSARDISRIRMLTQSFRSPPTTRHIRIPPSAARGANIHAQCRSRWIRMVRAKIRRAAQILSRAGNILRVFGMEGASSLPHRGRGEVAASTLPPRRRGSVGDDALPLLGRWEFGASTCPRWRVGAVGASTYPQ